MIVRSDYGGVDTGDDTDALINTSATDDDGDGVDVNCDGTPDEEISLQQTVMAMASHQRKVTA